MGPQDAAVTLPEEILRRISREAMRELPIRRYEGEVHLPSLVQVTTARRALTPIFFPCIL